MTTPTRTIDWRTGDEIAAPAPATPTAPTTTPLPTLIAMLLDRSGSMMATKSDAEGGFNAFIASQRALGGVCKITLSQFDGDSYDRVLTLVDVADVPPLVLEPRGNTPLLDSVARTIGDLAGDLNAMPEDNRPEKVIVVVITDGQENASRENTKESVKALIDAHPAWDFMYIGTHFDAFGQAGGMGFAASSTLQSSPESTFAAYDVATAAVTRTRTGLNPDFTDEEREQAK